MTTAQDTRARRPFRSSETARVLCCPVVPHPDAMAALAAYAPQADIVPLEQDDTYGYWREIRARWTGERDLIIIEQDNLIGESTIASLENCPEPWCIFAYPIFRDQVRLKYGLGCTKVSAAAQRLATIELIEKSFWLCAACQGAGCWWHLDGRVTEVLRGRGYAPHIHGDITHLHDYTDFDPYKRGTWEIPFLIDTGNSTGPALQMMTGISPGFALTPKEATERANQLASLAQAVDADPSQAAAADGDGFASVVQHATITGPAAPFSTDKIAHGYMPAYHRIVRELGPAARVCEAGVFFGGSLATWQVLFPDGLVAGIDNSPHALWPDGTIEIRAEQDDPALPAMLREHSPEWDLVIDDASHDGALTARTLELLWPLVRPGGFYVIEDWFTGYGDYPGFDDSMLRLAESLLQRLHEDTDTEDITYRHGMAILRKKMS